MTFSDYIDYLRDKRIGVIGFGVSNQPLVRVLLRNGCDVTVCDRRERAQLGAAGDEAAAQGAKFALGADYLEHLDFDVIFRTPGVLPIVPQLRKAAQNGAILTSEMEAFCNLCPCRILAITGSDGKTTTSTITAELLRAQGYTVHLGGNIGTPLFDRIFKPEVITLENGHTVTRPRSRTPLIALLVIAALAISVKVTGFNLAIIVKRANQLTKILSQIFQPDPSFFSKVVTPLLDTIKMSIMGSVIGCLLALPYAVAASANINRNKVSLSVLRFILNIVRTLPTLVIASICALVFGLGTFAGTVAIVIFTFGVVTKMLYESIETINMGPFEALESAGADKFRAFWSAVFPQVLPTYLSHCLYSFEMNVRAASILGYVGAGGLGILIDERIGWRDYNGLGTVLLTLFVAVLIIENLSQFLRSKLS